MLIFPTGAKAHNWFGAGEGEKIGHQAMSDEDLQGFVEVGEVELGDELPEEGTLEVADELESAPEEAAEEAEVSGVEEKVEEIKADLDELVEIVVTEGEGGALEIADEEPLESVTAPIEGDVEIEIEEPEEIEECGGSPAMAASDDAIVVANESGRWVKIAKLSPENKKKTRDYWLMLGFPQAYVDAMVKDYE